MKNGLHLGSWRKKKRVARPAYVMHTQWGWKVVLSVIEVSVLFMHVVSTYNVQLSPEKWLVSRSTHASADLPEQGAPRTASLPKFPYTFLIIPVLVIFLINLCNINIHRKYVKPFIKLNSKHNYSVSNFRSSFLQMREKLFYCLFHLALSSKAASMTLKMPSDNSSPVLLCKK